MKLDLRGHGERYTVEQEMLSLFPGERPVYGPPGPGDESWAVVELREDPDGAVCETELSWQGRRAHVRRAADLPIDDYAREGARRRLVGQTFFLAAKEAAGIDPPWGMLSGVRPDKLVTKALLEGRSPGEARRMLEDDLFVSPGRAALALETGTVAARTARSLGPRDIAVYVGIPFCPSRCAYCSFVSQSVEKSFGLIPAYVDALVEDLRRGGELAARLGLRPRAFYMGGGTPTTLSPDQLHRALSAFEEAFDLSACTERTVEAGRPDTIDEDRLAVLRGHGVDRISVNPQSMDDQVLRAIGRRHTAEDVERAMELTARSGIPHVNMDLIAGLPGDRADGFARSLDRCLAFGTDSVTVHTLARKKGSRVMTEGTAVPGAETVSAMLDRASAALRAAGHAPYYLYRQKYMSGSFENVGWARPGGTCLYNVLMMSELCTVLAFGAGGTTKLVLDGGRRIRRLDSEKWAEGHLGHPEKRAAVLAEVEAAYRETDGI